MRNGQTAAPAAVHPLNADETDARAEDLAVLLVDAVASGASVGSLAPLAPAVAAACRPPPGTRPPRPASPCCSWTPRPAAPPSTSTARPAGSGPV
ncbi:hypothetical protein ACFQWA_25635 [Streptomyces thermogriseus]|uniref:hypothetical protein n=1 Tax=Streptomyces thermogriseus TaxID=75292 RepID=UPI0036115260